MLLFFTEKKNKLVMKLLVVVFMFLPLFVFALYLVWKRERSKLPIIDRKQIGLGRDVVCFDSKFHNVSYTSNSRTKEREYCAICYQNIRLRVDRFVHYGNYERLCYICWKRENFVNIYERLMIFSDELTEDVRSVIRKYMLDDYWEICSYERVFPSSLKDFMVPIYKRLPTLNLPFHIKDSARVLRWPLQRSLSWICLSLYPEYDMYELNIYDAKTMRPYYAEQTRENNEANIRETFLLINKIQDMTLEEVEKLNIFLKIRVHEL